MATSTTTNLNLVKETNTEPIVNHRGHFNDNMDLIDAAYNTLASRSRGQQTWGNLKQNTTWGELIGTNVVAATTTTDNLELIQPGYDSTVDVESFNDNMSILDSTIGAIDVTNYGSIADQLSSVRDSLSYSTVPVTPSSNVLSGNIWASRLGRVLIVGMFCSLKAMTAWQDGFQIATIPFAMTSGEAIAYVQDKSRCVVFTANNKSLYIRNKNGVALGEGEWYIGNLVTLLT